MVGVAVGVAVVVAVGVGVAVGVAVVVAVVVAVAVVVVVGVGVAVVVAVGVGVGVVVGVGVAVVVAVGVGVGVGVAVGVAVVVAVAVVVGIRFGGRMKLEFTPKQVFEALQHANAKVIPGETDTSDCLAIELNMLLGEMLGECQEVLGNPDETWEIPKIGHQCKVPSVTPIAPGSCAWGKLERRVGSDHSKNDSSFRKSREENRSTRQSRA